MKDPPDILIKLIIIALGVIVGLWLVYIGHVVYTIFSPKQTAEINLERKPETTDLVLIEETALKSNVSPNISYSGTKLTRVITAYNPVKSQTDSSPCIAASGLNVCETNKKIFASNEFKFGQRIVIDGVIWECQDRTNSRYNFRIDLLMYDYNEAREWGIQTKGITLLN